ncbi:glycine zipper family protein [Rhodopila sp.]|uniref:glycine zipper family protein n=1 Tax=Rhodopila sp. TaxID=2480087 RepID=UPI003D11CD24
MRSLRLPVVMLAPLLLLDACASQPLGPTVAVMPAPGKPFEVFQGDQATCKQFAEGQVGGGAQRANNAQVGTAIVGTLLGAGLGAAVGGGRGAAIGAGAGALGGTAVGAGPSARSQYSLQQRYDLGYSQCMYARGNQVPGFQPPPPPGYAPSYPSTGNPPPGYARQPVYPSAGYPPPGYSPQPGYPRQPGYPPPG